MNGGMRAVFLRALSIFDWRRYNTAIQKRGAVWLFKQHDMSGAEFAPRDA